MGLNTFGIKYIINFAKKCNKLKVLVHVSTGQYVIRNKFMSISITKVRKNIN